VSVTSGTIDVAAIRADFPIEDVVRAAGVELRATGHGFTGRCPFHDDSTPSLSVAGVPDRFGCGAHGDVIDFVQRLHGLSFVDAVRSLTTGGIIPRPVSRRGIPQGRPPVTPAFATSEARGLKINALAWKHLSTPVAIAFTDSFLLHHRGIDLRPLRLEHPDAPLAGHSSHGWTTLTDQLRRDGVSGDELVTMDLARVTRSGSLVDTLRDRLVFPVTDGVGRIRGFIGRDLTDDPRAPKYRNPTRTPTFDKSGLIYRPTHHSLSLSGNVIVVEGVLDALALAAAASAAGRSADFAPCTTSGVTVTPAQTAQVIDLAAGRPAVIALDGDEAGAAGTARWLNQICLQRHTLALTTRLPAGLDPADWVRARGVGGLAAFDGGRDSAGPGSVVPVLPGRELARVVLSAGGGHIKWPVETLLPLVAALPAQHAVQLLSQVEREVTPPGLEPQRDLLGRARASRKRGRPAMASRIGDRALCRRRASVPTRRGRRSLARLTRPLGIRPLPSTARRDHNHAEVHRLGRRGRPVPPRSRRPSRKAGLCRRLLQLGSHGRPDPAGGRRPRPPRRPNRPTPLDQRRGLPHRRPRGHGPYRSARRRRRPGPLGVARPGDPRPRRTARDPAMSTTTAALLLLTADRVARELHTSTETITLPQWETFDNTVYRCLHTLLGPGRKLTGHDSAEGSAAIRAFQHYPTPLRPAPGETYSPTEASRLIGSNTHRVTRDAIAGRIPAERVDRALRIPAEELDRRPDLTPANSADTQPLARLTVAIGAMTDVLAGHRAAAGAALTDDRQIAAAMRHVLSLAAVAARHTLHTGAVADLDRPLLIAQYAERAVDALDGRSGYPQLWTMTSTNPPLIPRSLNDKLEVGLRTWDATARSHLKLSIPSTDVIRNIANQGVHILAVTDAVLAPHGEHAHIENQRNASGAESLRDAATALQGAERAWAGLSTGMPPTHEYVTASRTAFSALTDTASIIRTRAGRPTAGPRFDTDQALLDLTVATRDLTSLLQAVETLARRLLQSELLFVRSRTIAPRADILSARAKGQLVVARRQDVPDFDKAAREAWRQAEMVAEMLFARAAERLGRLPAAQAAVDIAPSL